MSFRVVRADGSSFPVDSAKEAVRRIDSLNENGYRKDGPFTVQKERQETLTHWEDVVLPQPLPLLPKIVWAEMFEGGSPQIVSEWVASSRIGDNRWRVFTALIGEWNEV